MEDRIIVYGDVKSLSGVKRKRIERYYKIFKELDIEFSVTITLDGLIYHLKYKNNVYDIEDDIIDDILDNNACGKHYKIEQLFIYINILSKNYTLKDVKKHIEEINPYFRPYKTLYNITDKEITCKSYIEWLNYHNKFGNKKLKTYTTDISFLNNKLEIKPKPCIYRFLNENNEIVYVGKTTNIKNRMYQHFISGGHLRQEQYNQVVKIEYIECKNEADMSIKEIYFINKYKPKFNISDLYKGEVHNSDYDSISWDNEYPIPNKQK